MVFSFFVFHCSSHWKECSSSLQQHNITQQKKDVPASSFCGQISSRCNVTSIFETPTFHFTPTNSISMVLQSSQFLVSSSQLLLSCFPFPNCHTFTNLACNPTGQCSWLLLDCSCWATRNAVEAGCNPLVRQAVGPKSPICCPLNHLHNGCCKTARQSWENLQVKLPMLVGSVLSSLSDNDCASHDN